MKNIIKLYKKTLFWIWYSTPLLLFLFFIKFDSSGENTKLSLNLIHLFKSDLSNLFFNFFLFISILTLMYTIYVELPLHEEVSKIN